MPHAALWVVQLIGGFKMLTRNQSFNAARGFVGGAAKLHHLFADEEQSFNAARGFVGGAAWYQQDTETIYSAFQCRTRLCGWCSEEASI